MSTKKTGNPMERERVAQAFGAVLRIARKQRGLSQESFAEEAQMDRSYPSLLERGLRTPTSATLIDIASALDVEPTQLVFDTTARLRGGQP